MIPPEIIEAAQQAQEATAVPAAVSVAQWALESDYGQHMPPQSNNPFGVKAVAGQPFSAANTWEVVGGRNVRMVQKFAKYESIADAFKAHAHLLATSHYYTDAMMHWRQGNLAAGVTSMARHYATDPNYALKIMAIIREHGLAASDDVA